MLVLQRCSTILINGHKEILSKRHMDAIVAEKSRIC